MTVAAQSLVELGALKSSGDAAAIGQRSNLDTPKLLQCVRSVAAEFVNEKGVEWSATVPADRAALADPTVFDFSERKTSNRAARLVDAARLGGKPGSHCLVTRVGDALQEPFWPWPLPS